GLLYNSATPELQSVIEDSLLTGKLVGTAFTIDLYTDANATSFLLTDLIGKFQTLPNQLQTKLYQRWMLTEIMAAKLDSGMEGYLTKTSKAYGGGTKNFNEEGFKTAMQAELNIVTAIIKKIKDASPTIFKETNLQQQLTELSAAANAYITTINRFLPIAQLKDTNADIKHILKYFTCVVSEKETSQAQAADAIAVNIEILINNYKQKLEDEKFILSLIPKLVALQQQTTVEQNNFQAKLEYLYALKMEWNALPKAALRSSAAAPLPIEVSTSSHPTGEEEKKGIFSSRPAASSSATAATTGESSLSVSSPSPLIATTAKGDLSATSPPLATTTPSSASATTAGESSPSPLGSTPTTVGASLAGAPSLLASTPTAAPLKNFLGSETLSRPRGAARKPPSQKLITKIVNELPPTQVPGHLTIGGRLGRVPFLVTNLGGSNLPLSTAAPSHVQGKIPAAPPVLTPVPGKGTGKNISSSRPQASSSASTAPTGKSSLSISDSSSASATSAGKTVSVAPSEEALNAMRSQLKSTKPPEAAPPSMPFRIALQNYLANHNQENLKEIIEAKAKEIQLEKPTSTIAPKAAAEGSPPPLLFLAELTKKAQANQAPENYKAYKAALAKINTSFEEIKKLEPPQAALNTATISRLTTLYFDLLQQIFKLQELISTLKESTKNCNLDITFSLDTEDIINQIQSEIKQLEPQIIITYETEQTALIAKINTSNEPNAAYLQNRQAAVTLLQDKQIENQEALKAKAKDLDAQFITPYTTAFTKESTQRNPKDLQSLRLLEDKLDASVNFFDSLIEKPFDEEQKKFMQEKKEAMQLIQTQIIKEIDRANKEAELLSLQKTITDKKNKIDEITAIPFELKDKQLFLESISSLLKDIQSYNQFITENQLPFTIDQDIPKYEAVQKIVIADIQKAYYQEIEASVKTRTLTNLGSVQARCNPDNPNIAETRKENIQALQRLVDTEIKALALKKEIESADIQTSDLGQLQELIGNIQTHANLIGLVQNNPAADKIIGRPATTKLLLALALDPHITQKIQTTFKLLVDTNQLIADLKTASHEKSPDSKPLEERVTALTEAKTKISPNNQIDKNLVICEELLSILNKSKNTQTLSAKLEALKTKLADGNQKSIAIKKIVTIPPQLLSVLTTPLTTTALTEDDRRKALSQKLIADQQLFEGKLAEIKKQVLQKFNETATIITEKKEIKAYFDATFPDDPDFVIPEKVPMATSTSSEPMPKEIIQRIKTKLTSPQSTQIKQSITIQEKLLSTTVAPPQLATNLEALKELLIAKLKAPKSEVTGTAKNAIIAFFGEFFPEIKNFSPTAPPPMPSSSNFSSTTTSPPLTKPVVVPPEPRKSDASSSSTTPLQGSGATLSSLMAKFQTPSTAVR
ncbi:MAG: hypothetical protein WC860_01040, partial [Candidatus Margulisiibacteriota bacterium]